MHRHQAQIEPGDLPEEAGPDAIRQSHAPQRMSRSGWLTSRRHHPARERWRSPPMIGATQLDSVAGYWLPADASVAK